MLQNFFHNTSTKKEGLRPPLFPMGRPARPHAPKHSDRGAAAPYALACFLAAAMNSRNSGCGAMGRDLNSGWNWQPKNQG